LEPPDRLPVDAEVSPSQVAALDIDVADGTGLTTGGGHVASIHADGAALVSRLTRSFA
jgi:hypothetical protein